MSTTKNTAPGPRHLRVFLASSGDVEVERKLALEVLDKLPDDPVFRDKITIRPIVWDKPGAGTPMLATITPQEAIKQGLPEPGRGVGHKPCLDRQRQRHDRKRRLGRCGWRWRP